MKNKQGRLNNFKVESFMTSVRKRKFVFALPIVAATIIVVSCSSENKESGSLNLSDLKPKQTDTIIIPQPNGLTSLLIVTGYDCPNELTVDNKKIFAWVPPMDFSNVKKGDMFIFQDDKSSEVRQLTVVSDFIKDYDVTTLPLANCK